MAVVRLLAASLLLAGAALLVYDLLREGEARALPVAPLPEAPAPDAREAGRAARREHDDLLRRLAALETRVELLASRAARPVASAPPACASAVVAEPPVAVEVRPDRVAPVGAIDAADVARFRALEQASRDARRVEDLRGRLARRIEASHLRLDEAQRRRVIEASVGIWARVQRVQGEAAAAGVIRDPGGPAMTELRGDFAADIERIVAGSQVEAVVDRLAPAIGLAAPSAFRDDGNAQPSEP